MIVMKRFVPYFAILAIPVLFSCNQESNKGVANDKADSVLNTTCYQAIDGVDTAKMNVDETAAGKIKGKLYIKFEEKGPNDGTFEGEFRGDTLFVDYSFTINTTNKTVYKNPLAFLKKDGKLLMGVGQIQTTLGRSFFVKGKPIDFEKGRFQFAPVDCK